MTIPSPPSPFSFGQIRTEFGPNDSPLSSNFSNYRKYPGGTRVGATPLTVPIPSSLPLSMKTFAGTQSGYPKTTNNFTSGSGSVTIPSGVRTIAVDVWGGGGGGNQGRTIMCFSCPGAGGSGGGLARSSFAILGPSWGKTISYSVGAAGAGNPGAGPPAPAIGQPGTPSTAQSGTYTIPAMTGGGGNAGASGGGGTASGGTTSNTTGNSGGPTGCGVGATGLSGTDSNTGGAGGTAGAAQGDVGQSGQSGRVLFTWT